MSRGFAQIPVIIVLLLTAVSLPFLSQYVSKNFNDTRSKAGYSCNGSCVGGYGLSCSTLNMDNGSGTCDSGLICCISRTNPSPTPIPGYTCTGLNQCFGTTCSQLGKLTGVGTCPISQFCCGASIPLTATPTPRGLQADGTPCGGAFAVCNCLSGVTHVVNGVTICGPAITTPDCGPDKPYGTTECYSPSGFNYCTLSGNWESHLCTPGTSCSNGRCLAPTTAPTSCGELNQRCCSGEYVMGRPVGSCNAHLTCDGTICKATADVPTVTPLPSPRPTLGILTLPDLVSPAPSLSPLAFPYSPGATQVAPGISASTVDGGTKYAGTSDQFSPYAQYGKFSASDADAKCDLVDAKAGKCGREALDAMTDALAWPATLVAQTLSNYCSLKAESEGSCKRTSEDTSLETTFNIALSQSGTLLSNVTNTYQNVRTNEVILASYSAASIAALAAVAGPAVVANAGPIFHTVNTVATVVNMPAMAAYSADTCGRVLGNPNATEREKVTCGLALSWTALSFVPGLNTLKVIKNVTPLANASMGAAYMTLGGINTYENCKYGNEFDCVFAAVRTGVDVIGGVASGVNLVKSISLRNKINSSLNSTFDQWENTISYGPTASGVNTHDYTTVYHGSESPLTVKSTWTMAEANLAEKEGSLTLGMGLYTTPDKTLATNYSSLRAQYYSFNHEAVPGNVATVQINPLANVVDLTEGSVNKAVPSSWLSEWRSYVDTSYKPSQVFGENLANKFYNGQKTKYLNYLDNLNDQSPDLRQLLGTQPGMAGTYFNESPPWVDNFNSFMNTKGVDAAVVFEGGENFFVDGGGKSVVIYNTAIIQSVINTLVNNVNK